MISVFTGEDTDGPCAVCELQAKFPTGPQALSLPGSFPFRWVHWQPAEGRRINGAQTRDLGRGVNKAQWEDARESLPLPHPSLEVCCYVLACLTAVCRHHGCRKLVPADKELLRPQTTHRAREMFSRACSMHDWDPLISLSTSTAPGPAHWRLVVNICGMHSQ